MNNFDQIGQTPLIPLNSLAGEPLKAEVLIKDESANPTGTHKDRKSAWLIEKALEDDVDTLAILTAGNAGYSLATLAQGTGIEIVTIVSQNVRPKIKHTLESVGAKIVETDFSQSFTTEDICKLVRSSRHQNIWDVTNNGHEAHQEIYREIADEDADLILCPIGSGELYIGLIEGLQEAQNTRTRVMGLFPQEVKASLADKLCTEYLPLQWEMLSKQIADMEEQTGTAISHGMGDVLEKEIQWGIDHAPQDLNAEPSALITLHMIDRLRNSDGLKMIVINTGKGKMEE